MSKHLVTDFTFANLYIMHGMIVVTSVRVIRRLCTRVQEYVHLQLVQHNEEFNKH